jgi:predicted SnoaL-like aldol condensation-catalyzing enzyme
MKKIPAIAVGFGMMVTCQFTALSQVPPVAATDQSALLASPDPKLAANKKLVFDMWRTVIQAGRADLAPQFFTEGYIQLAERDMVMLATVSYEDDPDNPGKKYAGTHFDLFRVENGKIAEHWDSVPKSREMAKRDPNQQNEIAR